MKNNPHMRRKIILVSPLAVWLFLSSFAMDAHPAESTLERSEAAIGNFMGNYRLVNQDGRQVPMHSFKGQVLLLNFMYIDCPDTCITTNLKLGELRDSLEAEVAEQLVIISVSIDPENDTPEKLKEYGRNFTDNFNRWLFTTTDKATLEMMVSDLGFSYENSGEMIEHLNRITLIDSNGRVARHFYGTEFDVREVEESIKTLLSGKSIKKSALAAYNSILLYCSTYDPISKTYRTDYALVASIVIQYLLVMATIIYLLRHKILQWLPFR